jgi:hypothetical protein
VNTLLRVIPDLNMHPACLARENVPEILEPGTGTDLRKKTGKCSNLKSKIIVSFIKMMTVETVWRCLFPKE